MSMLKNLKNKKDGKADPKKDKKEKETKKEEKKQPREEEEETGDPLVDMSEFDTAKEDTKAKKINKALNSKLQEKEIDTSNIVVEKKEEKPEVKSWVVNEEDIKKTFSKKFDMTKEDTDFQSLTDEKFNKELEVKKAKEAEENKNNVIIEEKGIKYAQLEKAPVSNFVDINESNFTKRQPEAVSTNFPTSGISPEIKFSNSKMGAFVPLEKTAQQKREEEMERRQNEIAIAPKKEGWLGKKSDQTTVEPQETKLSGWGARAVESGDAPPINPNNNMKFAPLKKSQIEKRYERQEQEFVFVSKKDMQERKKKREEEKEKAVKS